MVDCSQLEVFVVTYNRRDKLKKMLESLCCQTARGFKITVLDNASTDNTREVVKDMQLMHPHRNIGLVTHNENLGNLGNFKMTQKMASLKYTAVFHDDDVIHPEYLERVMNLFAKHENAVVCTGGAQAVFMPENCNWPLLGTQYYVYPKGCNTYMQMMVQRASFQTVVYRTEVYKRTNYHKDLYGKLHDIIFLMEVGEQGEMIYVSEPCARIGIDVSQDSSDLKSGPFPDEILEIVCRIDELMKGQKYAKPVLWNFTYFLYEWSCLSHHVTWDAFKEKLITRSVFTNVEVMNFSMKSVMDRINGEILSLAETLKFECAKNFKGFRSGLI